MVAESKVMKGRKQLNTSITILSEPSRGKFSFDVLYSTTYIQVKVKKETKPIAITQLYLLALVYL